MPNRRKIIDKILPIENYGCYFRLVELEDAEFIHSLRSNEKLSRFINAGGVKVKEQINWLKEYKIREKNGLDFYIICLTADKKIKLGLNRIYDIKENEFEIGSWVFSPDAGPNDAIYGDLFARSLAFEQLDLKICKIAVKKNNRPVLRYTKSFNPTLVAEDATSYFFELDYDTFKIQRDKILRIIQNDR